MPRVIATDDISKKPKVDVDGVSFVPLVVSVTSGTSNERSRYTKSVMTLAQENGENFDPSQYLDDQKFKRCQKCYKVENEEALNKWRRGEEAAATEKFRYCEGCQLAVYCSKKCQAAEWPDHRLLCNAKKSK